MSQDKQRLANKRFGETLSDGFRLFKQTYLKIIPVFALFYLITIILSIVLLAPLQADFYNYYIDHKETITDYMTAPLDQDYSQGEINVIMTFLLKQGLISFLYTLIGGIFTTIALCSVSIFLFNTYTQGKSNFKEDFKRAFNGKLFSVVIVLGVIVSACFGVVGINALLGIVTIIPGMFLFLYYIFSIYTYNIEGVENPFQESKAIARGSSTKILGTFLASYFIAFIFDLIYGFTLSFFWNPSYLTYLSWYKDFGQNFGLIFLYDLLFALVEIILAPLFICLLTPLFASLKTRKDMGFQQQPKFEPQYQPKYQPQYQPQYQQQYQPQPDTYKPTPISQPEQGKGMFCPFCGQKILSPKKFCPNCGESLDFE